MRTLSSTGSDNPIPLRRLLLSTGALLTIPVVIHYGAVSGHAGLALALVAAGVLLPGVLTAPRRGRVVPMALVLLALVAMWAMVGSLSLLYALPVLINLALCGLFALTLLPGRKPLISAYVELQYTTVSPATYRYTRKVTQAWAVFFGLMALQTLLLAWLAPVEIWSLFANLLNYVFVGLMFAAEYGVRRRVLRDRRHAGFVQFLGTLTRTDFRQLLKQST